MRRARPQRLLGLIFFDFIDYRANTRPHRRANRPGDHQTCRSARGGAFRPRVDAGR